MRPIQQCGGIIANAEKGFLVIYESDKHSVEVNSTLSNLSGYREKIWMYRTWFL